MANIIIAGATHTCPLCLSKFTEDKLNPNYLACEPCGVRIKKDDFLLGKWSSDDARFMREDNVECPMCYTEMRFFCNSSGYMQAKCPKCKTKIETKDDVNGPGIKEGDLCVDVDKLKEDRENRKKKE